jgi:DNA-binding CsgD family transcriptional regulator
MASRLACSPQNHTDELFKVLLSRRSRPCVVFLDVDLNVAFADPYALTLLRTRFGPCPQLSTLPSSVHDPIADLIRRWDDRGTLSDDVIGPIEGLALRVVPLSGPQGSFYAVFFQEDVHREDLRAAVAEFSFTPRELDVLDLILGGMNAAEIAEDLHIAEVTVFDHFKHISQKTNARNRADMLGKVFNWQAGLTGKGPSRGG